MKIINKQAGEIATTLTIISLLFMIGGLLVGNAVINNTKKLSYSVSAIDYAFTIDNKTTSDPFVKDYFEATFTYPNPRNVKATPPTGYGDAYFLPGTLCFENNMSGSPGSKYKLLLIQGKNDSDVQVGGAGTLLSGLYTDYVYQATRKCTGTGGKRPESFNISFRFLTDLATKGDKLYVVFEQQGTTWVPQLSRREIMAIITINPRQTATATPDPNATATPDPNATDTPTPTLSITPTPDYSTPCTGDINISGKIKIINGNLYDDKYITLEAAHVSKSGGLDTKGIYYKINDLADEWQRNVDGYDYQINNIPMPDAASNNKPNYVAVVLWKNFVNKNNGNNTPMSTLNLYPRMENCSGSNRTSYSEQDLIACQIRIPSDCQINNANFVLNAANVPQATPPPGSTATPVPPTAPPGSTATPVPPTAPPGSTATPIPPTVPPGSTATPANVPPGSTITTDPNRPTDTPPTAAPTAAYCGLPCAVYPTGITPPVGGDRCCIYGSSGLSCKPLTVGGNAQDYCVSYANATTCTDDNLAGCCQPTTIPPTATPIPPTVTLAPTNPQQPGPTTSGGSANPYASNYIFVIPNNEGKTITQTDVYSKVCGDAARTADCKNDQHIEDKQQVNNNEFKVVSVTIHFRTDIDIQYLYFRIVLTYSDGSTKEIISNNLSHQISRPFRSNLYRIELKFERNGKVTLGQAVDETKLSDVDNSGCVNTLDFSKVVTKYGVDTENNPDSADINSDGIINGLDLTYVLSHWNEGERCGN